MKKPRIRFAAKACVLAAAALLSTIPVSAGIPVIDGANLANTIITALEEVAQTYKQIEEYKTQLDQYELELTNIQTPSAYLWDQAQATIANLQRATDTLNYYKNLLGSLDSYLAKFQDVSYYRASSCFQRSGCSAEQRAALDANSVTSSQALKKAHDAMFRSIDQQQKNLSNDAAQLQRLQGRAEGAEGQLQALGYANQLASNQANQLLQIRSLLIAQQNAQATRASMEADREALRAASGKALRDGTLRRGTDAGVRAW